ncbi:MAG: F0F1 ATP synthase subunit epsilon [Phycisphaerae bacterium]|nr:F0F1 ATP synthase subunit epsilon [Phycisphaerae bacterium]
MPASFRCSIVTPSQSVLNTDASYVSYEAWDGQRGVLDGSSASLTQLAVGTVRVDLAAGGTKTYVIDSGFAQMRGNALTILTDVAVDSAEINAAAAEREYADARARVVEPGNVAPEARARLERAQRLAATKVRVARG